MINFLLFFGILDTTAQSQSKFPKTSPDINSSTKITDISSSSLKDDDLDYDDEDTENISVTGSPDISCINELENQQDTKRESGAFTSIIQKSQRKTEFNPSFPVNSNLAASNPMHHALAAHLFFQNPLLPPPNQWLYNHLYNNYHDFPWLRNTLAVNSQINQNINGNNTSDNVLHSTVNDASTSSTGMSLIKRSITLLTNNSSTGNHDKENDSDVQSSSSPPVTSTKRSSSPDLPRDPIISKRKRSSSVESITIPNENINDSNRKSENFNSRNRMSQAVKSSDVWRPY